MKPQVFAVSAEVKALDAESGVIEGYASTTGNIDLQGDIVTPGAYEGLEDFVRDGHLLWGHDHSQPPIGFIESAREDARGLWFRAKLFAGELGNRVRAMVRERLQAGKSVGLSIGFRVIDWDLRADGIRLLKKITPFEVSVVPFPANQLATVTALKALDAEDMLAQLRGRYYDSIVENLEAKYRAKRDEDLQTAMIEIMRSRVV